MAQKFLTNIDLNKNELQNATIQNLATAPSTPATGQVYFDTADGALKIYDGSAWANVEGDITGVTAGTGLTGGGTGGDVTISIDTTGVTAASYGSATAIPVLTVNAQGQITAATTAAISSTLDIAADSGTDDGVQIGTDTLTFTGGTGVTTSVSGDTVTFAIGQAVGTTADVTFNSVTAALTGNVTGNVTGNLTGDVTGDVTGNLTGNVTGNVTGDVTGDVTGNVTGNVTAGLIRVGVTANNEIDTSSGNLTIDSAGGTVTVDDNLVISGDLTVSGTTTTVNTETINLADNVIVINSNATGSATENGGIEIERGDDTNVTLLWDESNNRWTIGSETFVAGTFIGDLTGDVTGNVTGNLTGTVLTASQTNITAIGTIATGEWQATDIAVAHGGTGASTAAGAKTNLGFMTRYAATIGNNSDTAIAVTHNLGTDDVVVEVYDATTKETVVCDVDRTSTNEVTLTFASAPDTNELRVVIIG